MVVLDGGGVDTLLLPDLVGAAVTGHAAVLRGADVVGRVVVAHCLDHVVPKGLDRSVSKCLKYPFELNNTSERRMVLDRISENTFNSRCNLLNQWVGRPPVQSEIRGPCRREARSVIHLPGICQSLRYARCL